MDGVENCNDAVGALCMSCSGYMRRDDIRRIFDRGKGIAWLNNNGEDPMISEN
jgi:hypothetical protein